MRLLRMCTVLAAVAGLVSLTACGALDDSPSASGNQIRIAHNTNAGMLPARVAQEQGYFKDEGLDVSFRIINNINTLPPALGKSFDIVSTTGPDLINANTQGIPMVEVSAITVDTPENPTAGIVVLKQSGISSIAQLNGKSLGVLTKTGGLHLATLAWLKREGVAPAQVQVRQIDGPSMTDQLIAGRVTALEGVDPFRGQTLDRPGTVDIGDPYLKVAPSLGNIIWGAQDKWVKDHPKAVQGFRNAIKRAIVYIQQHPTEARKTLAEYTKLPADVIAKTKLPTYSSEPRPQDLEVWANIMHELGDYNGQIDVKKLVAE